MLSTFAIGFAMAGGAWWYNYQQSRLAAEFWGRQNASLLVGNSEVTLLELGEPDAAGVAKRETVREIDLTDKKGLVHLRHSLTYDANFVWEKRRHEPLGDGDAWTYAMRFSRGNAKLEVLFASDFQQLGRVVDASAAEPTVDVLRCPRLGPVLLAYLAEVGVEFADSPADAPR